MDITEEENEDTDITGVDQNTEYPGVHQTTGANTNMLIFQQTTTIRLTWRLSTTSPTQNKRKIKTKKQNKTRKGLGSK